jgi:hypothetical protein
MTNGREFSKPATYEIRVKGNLEPTWSDWFDGFTMTRKAANEIVLRGQVADQPALHGLLAKIRDLGLPLLAVERLENRVRECDRAAHDPDRAGEVPRENET